jgi:hypothetical protein
MVATVVLLFAQFVPGAPLIPWGGTDFLQYYAANQLLLEGKNPYDRELNTAKQESFGRIIPIETYTPPWGFLPALPLSWLSFETAVRINILLNCLILALCGFWWTRLLFPEDPRLALFALISLPLWLPCLSVAGIGQISLWPLLGFTGWLYCTKRQRHVPAGLFLALTIIKPHLGILLGLFAGMDALRRRHWGVVTGFMVTFAFLTLLTFLLRISIWQDYVQSVQSSTSLALIHPATIAGWIKDNLGEPLPILTWAIWGLGLVLAGTAGWWWSGPQTDSNQTRVQSLISWSAIMSIATVAVVPYAFSFDFVLMLPGFILAIGIAATRNGLRWRMAILVWLAMELCLVTGKLVTWSESSYCLIPWVGLAATIWLERHRFSCPRTSANA